MRYLHEGLHAAGSGAPSLAALHSTELVQVLQQHPGLLDAAPQLGPPHVHLDPQPRSACTPGKLTSQGGQAMAGGGGAPGRGYSQWWLWYSLLITAAAHPVKAIEAMQTHGSESQCETA